MQQNVTLPRKIAMAYGILITIFIFFIASKSRMGVILFGDNDISLWRDNYYLLNRYLWISTENGFFSPIFVITLPFQFIFRVFTLIFNINVVSSIYFYGSLLGLILATIYLVKGINKNAKIIDYLVVSFFSIGTPLLAGVLMSQNNIAYSFIAVSFFLGYLFRCRNKNKLSLKDIVILLILILFINTYILNTALLLGTLLAYTVFFHLKFLLMNKLKVACVLGLFVMLNMFWIIVPFQNALLKKSPEKTVSFYSVESANAVLTLSSNSVRLFSPFMFSSSYIKDPSHSAEFFSREYIVFSVFIITITVLAMSFFYSKKTDKKMVLFLLSIFLFFYFLSLGNGGPLKEFFLFFWSNVPGFTLFRSLFKFQFVMHFAFVILLVLSLENLRGKIKAKLIFLIPSAVLMSFYILNPYYVRLTQSSKIPEYYFQAQYELDQTKMVSSYKIFPDKYYNAKFIYTQFDWNKNEWDSANVMRFFTEKNTVFTPFNGVDIDQYINKILCGADSKERTNATALIKIFGIFNIKNLIFQNDVLPSGTICFNSMPESNFSKKSIGRLDVYSIFKNSFLPHFYTPTNIIVSQRSVDELPRMLYQSEWQTRSAVFFEGHDPNKNTSLLREWTLANNGLTPILEFMKINPTKYRVRVHGASGVFPIIFSESFHDGWKAYLAQAENLRSDLSEQISKYKILDGNEEDQADLDELGDFIQKGWVTDLGGGEEKQTKHKRWDADKQKEELDYVEKYNVDFVSKNFQGTIQNDNLPKGHFWETWLQKPIENNENHLMVNGYANSWVMDTDSICNPKNNSLNSSGANCVRNADGSYDMEIIVEFWPQRLFYVGVGISGVTLLGCLIYLAYDWRKKRKPNVDQKIQ